MDVMVLVICLAVLTVLFWVGYHVTGALLAAIIWLCVKLPLAIIFGGLGVVCCATILLIPLGLLFFRGGLRILT